MSKGAVMDGTTLAIDFESGLSDAWSSIATFVPTFLAFLVILIVGWLIAKALGKGLDMLLRRVGMERLAERSGMSRMFENSDWDTTRLISRVVYYALVLVVLQAAFGVFGQNPISDVLASIVAWLPQAIVALVIVVVAAAVANALRQIVRSALSSRSYGDFLATAIWAFVIALGVIAAVNQIGVAQFVTNALLIAALAIVVGVAIIGLGGGMIRPMQERWSGWLNRIETETEQAKVPQARQSTERTAEQTGTQQPTTGQSTTGTAPG